MPADLPVIFIAFANDREDRSLYLRNLSREHDLIRKSLDEAVKDGLCELVERYNATLDEVVNVFQDARYRDRNGAVGYGAM